MTSTILYIIYLYLNTKRAKSHHKYYNKFILYGMCGITFTALRGEGGFFFGIDRAWKLTKFIIIGRYFIIIIYYYPIIIRYEVNI